MTTQAQPTMPPLASDRPPLAGPQMSGTYVRWPLPEALISSPEVAYRNRFAEALALKRPEEIASSYVYLTAKSMQRLVDLAIKHTLCRSLAGLGMELGAGCGLLSATVARSPAVKGVLALEICEKMVELVIPKIAAWVLGCNSSKVTPVLGSFDDLQLPDASLDFAIEIDSLHHSKDLARTLKECARVLKPGGVLICLDRCHPNTVSDADVEEMLSRVYSREFLVSNHYPPHIALTRRDNGEHEYRLYEWEAAFKRAGLRLVRAVHICQQIPAKKAVKGLLSCLPRPFRARLRLSQSDTCAVTASFIRQSSKRVIRTLLNRHEIVGPKETTVFCLEKL